MKIWIDISNAPHVNFFKGFIRDWQEKHEVIVTTRPLSNTIDLLKKHDIEFHVVGSHYGKKSISKLFGFFKRCYSLRSFLKGQHIDFAISQSSFYSPFVAKSLHIPCAYTNDNEYAKGNHIGFLLADYILLPEALNNWAKGRYFQKRTIFYPGVKEGIYLNPLDITKKIKPEKIYFRPEPWHAQYHEYAINTFNKMLNNLASIYKVVVLPRDESQKTYFSNLAENNKNIEVLNEVENIYEITRKCCFFIGAGGSMTREFAILGIPTISIYQGKPLKVDEYLIEKGVMVREKDPMKINLSLLNSIDCKEKLLAEYCNSIFEKGKEARNMINQIVNNIYAEI